MPLERETTILPPHRRRDPAMCNATTNRSIVGRIAVGLIAAVLLLGACGGDDNAGSDPGSDSAVDTAANGGNDSTSSDDTSSDDGSESSAEGVAPTPEGPSGGLQLDDAWPEQVWVPADVTTTGGSFRELDNGLYEAMLFLVTDADLDDVRDALVRGNGTPDSEGENVAGYYNMSYDDLLPGQVVSFQLMAEAPGTALVVNMFP